MSTTIPLGQFIGNLVGISLFIFGGIWCIFFWPRQIRRQIDNGEIDAFDGVAKARKAPFYGYFLLILAIGDGFNALTQIGVLPQTAFTGFVFFMFAICSVWWFRQKKKNDS